MRLLTRFDFDGLACGVLLKDAGLIDSFLHVHPKDIQDEKITVTDNDILANVPFNKNCGMWFDHHSSEIERLSLNHEFKGESRPAKSAARIIYDFLGGDKKLSKYKEMVDYVDKVDSGELLFEEIINPQGWIMLGFIMDPRTGLERNKELFKNSRELMENLLDDIRFKTIEEIFELDYIRIRREIYKIQTRKFKKMILANTKTYNNVMVTDLRNTAEIFTGNRFLKYTLFPKQNISIWVVNGKSKKNVSVAVGYSVLNRSSSADVGKIMLSYGGGGHKMVGTCQIPYENSDETIVKIIDALIE